ncbi:MAG: hypothetical protein IJD99_00570 [Clostridia bacterium]|nr:hypothetical protein [Clostridia bacterium]
MRRKNLPAWQQVVLAALENVPKAKDGHDAWDGLNPEEQAGVMDFLNAHCGEEAQAKLEESCGMVKSQAWRWGEVIAYLLMLAVVMAGFVYVEMRLDKNHSMIFWTFYSLNRVIDDVAGARRTAMREIWNQREQTQEGVSIALENMKEVVVQPLSELCKGGWLILHGIMLFVSVMLAMYELLS